MEKSENILGFEKIGKLIVKFSIPCIISMVVSALYNIVDQIFIGWDLGYLGNGATTIVYPLNLVCIAFSLMIGDGAAAFFSLKLGENKKEVAGKGVATGIISTTIVAVVLCVIMFAFMPQLLNLFGCTDALREYAHDYGYIIAIGLPFNMFSITMNSIIRTDGSPRFSMVSMLIGAVLNMALDPIFIFVCKWGIKGAAWATVISQVVAFIPVFIYIWKIKSIKLKKSDFKPDIKIFGKIMALGIGSFISQFSFVIVNTVQNNLIKKYGISSVYGVEIPITVLGIVMKVWQIMNSVIMGIAVGSQPIIGFNYGAQQYKRVKTTIKLVIIINLIIGALATVLFQTIPEQLIGIFGGGDDNYMEFARLSFRIYLMLYALTAVSTSVGIFLQSIGKYLKSAIISSARQIIFLVPFMFLFGYLYGVIGILISGAVTDFCAFALSGIVLLFEIRQLNKLEKEKITELGNQKLFFKS